jgi:hypothetical protein
MVNRVKSSTLIEKSQYRSIPVVYCQKKIIDNFKKYRSVEWFGW